MSFSAGGWTTSDRHDSELKETIDDLLADRKIVDRENPTPETTIPMLPSILSRASLRTQRAVLEDLVDRADMSAEQLAYYKIGATTEEKANGQTNSGSYQG